VGTFAVQIGKALGGEVTAVCSTGNVELVRSLGADHVVDYTQEDFTRSDRRYDVLLDVAGSKSLRASKRVLARDARFVIVGGSRSSRLLGPLGHVAGTILSGVWSSLKVGFFIAKLDKEDMEVLRGMLETGKITPVIDRQYELSEVAEAFEYMGEGHCRSKIVVTM
jgi:NADPH:quinone reductase-like Zn-dependent oxidoreductase